MHCLVFTDTDLYSLTKGKPYLAKQKWRRSTCLRDQCYDVGCHPCGGRTQCLRLIHVLMTHGFRMSRALRQTARIAATECACALSCFNLTACDSLT